MEFALRAMRWSSALASPWGASVIVAAGAILVMACTGRRPDAARPPLPSCVEGTLICGPAAAARPRITDPGSEILPLEFPLCDSVRTPSPPQWFRADTRDTLLARETLSVLIVRVSLADEKSAESALVLLRISPDTIVRSMVDAAGLAELRAHGTHGTLDVLRIGYSRVKVEVVLRAGYTDTLALGMRPVCREGARQTPE